LPASVAVAPSDHQISRNKKMSKINHVVAAAIAATLASAAANAAITFHVTGASAQRNAWIAELKNEVCLIDSLDASGNPVFHDFQEYRAYDAAKDAANTAQPDFRAYRCTAKAQADLPASWAANTIGSQVVTMQYSAELGSIWGVVPFIKNVDPASALPTQHVFLNPDDATCTFNGNTALGSVAKANYIGCTVGTYTASTDSAVTAPSLVLATPDIGVTDVEPTMFVGTNLNWPTALGGIFVAANQPTAATLALLKSFTSPFQVLNGQVFAVAVDASVATWLPQVDVAPTLDASGNIIGGVKMPNLASTTVTSIFSGKHKTWSEIPGVADPAAGTGGTNIIVCRRDVGSGSQAAAQLYFEGGIAAAGAKCSATNQTFVTPIIKGRLATGAVVVNNSTDDMKNFCFPGAGSTPAGGKIGFFSNGGDGTAYKVVALDGVAPSAHNAATGLYHFWYETWGVDNTAQSGTTGDTDVLIAAVIKSAQTASSLPFEASATARGVNFALPGVAGNVTTAAATNPAATTINNVKFNAPISLMTRAGNSCQLYPANGNTL
jgi:hypothetical protein